MTPSDLLYQGKCKKIFTVQQDPCLVIMKFTDNLTAFNGKKQSSFVKKGQINRDTSSLIFRYLQSKGIPNHWVQDRDQCEMVTVRMKMIPLEVVVRNYLAGSTAKKFLIPDGTKLSTPLFEFYYKDESLNDPFISTEQALMLKALTNQEEAVHIKELALKVNQELSKKFLDAGMSLIDFKLEFGKDKNGHILLGDEISADSCRIWNKNTKEKMDKDRFRLDLGDIEKNYRAIYQNLISAIHLPYKDSNVFRN